MEFKGFFACGIACFLFGFLGWFITIYWALGLLIGVPIILVSMSSQFQSHVYDWEKMELIQLRDHGTINNMKVCNAIRQTNVSKTA